MTRTAEILRSMVKAALKPRPIQRVWQWIDDHVSIPLLVGSTNPGPMDTALVPPMRGLYQLYWMSRVHFFTLAKSARVGGTLLAICCVLHKISTWPGPILWVDPTRKTALRFSRSELQPHIMECPPAHELAVISKTTWTTTEMQFKANTLGLVGAGSAADLGGRQAELVVLNEREKFRQDQLAEAPADQLAVVRSKQFRHTRKVLSNSTPTIDSGNHWQDFLAGSQDYCYLPCPHCSKANPKGWKAPPLDKCDVRRSPLSYEPGLKGWQRFTFFTEEKEVPFTRAGKPLPDGETRIEKTGQFHFAHCKKKGRDDYDLAKVEQETTYQCGECSKEIEHTDLNWMLRRWWWRPHNAKAPLDHISAHFWAAYSPFEHWGQLAKKFLLARGSISKMHDLYNSDFGVPFVRHATTLKDSDIDLVVKRSPDYALRELPKAPIFIDMNVDVQGFGFWWTVRAWGIDWEHQDWPTWSALIDYGMAVSWEQIEEIAGLKKQDDGKRNGYTFDGVDYHVMQGLIDSGFEAQQGKKVYEFCKKHADVFNPSKGGSRQHLRGKFITEAPVSDDELMLLWYWDDHFKQSLYYECIKEGKRNWWLPRDVGGDYRAQLTAERTVEAKQKNGTIALEWVVEGEQGNHLGDCEKMAETRRDGFEAVFEEMREKRREEEERT
jgi:phage terminase large subunit GpA-like protein